MRGGCIRRLTPLRHNTDFEITIHVSRELLHFALLHHALDKLLHFVLKSCYILL